MNDEGRESFDLDLSHQTPRIHPRTKEQKTQQPLMWFYLGSAGQIGFAILVPLLIGVFAGVWLDQQNGTKPMWTLIGLVAGIVLSIASLVHTVQEILKKKI